MTGGGDDLSVTSLLEEAAARAGTSEWGDLSFLPALELWVRSCEQTGALNALGRSVLRKVIVRHLRNRLAMTRYVGLRPHVTEVEIRHPVVVTGLPRTGTTLLHNLLALDPGQRVLHFWEGLHPVPPGADGSPGETELVAQAERWLDRLHELAPEFRRIHPVTATGPEECDALLQNSFASQHFEDMFRAEEYSDWLAHAALDREYAYYRLQLQALSGPAHHPAPWALKSPSHLGHLDALLATLPDASIVLCHRHPLEAIPSYASLVAAVRRPHTDELSLEEVGRHALGRCQVAVEHAMRVREEADAERFIDLSYGRLVADPLSTVAEVYERLGRELTEDATARMAQWLDDHPRHLHGVHRYAAEDFGLRPDEMARRLGAYTERFGPFLGS